VRLRNLLVTDYRNIKRAEIDMDAGAIAFIGENAQGKSNLLEAINLLATMKSVRAETDVQVVRQEAMDDVLPAARVVAHVSTTEGPLKIEVTVLIRPGAKTASKTVKVNGAARQLSAAVGRMTAVLFTAEDMEMFTGSPSLRRRYLDVTLSQVDPEYSRSRSRFERLLPQRNALLKRIREGLAQASEMAYWDSELAVHGGRLIHRRAHTTGRIAELAATAQARLAPGEMLNVAYAPSLAIPPGESDWDEALLQRIYQERLSVTLDRDIAAGMTLTGPHRDDVAFELNGMDAASFASRAQQRTIALALRLAEAKFLTERRGEPPVLLLDDILSEMDASRRRTVMASIGDVDQLVITGTDSESLPASFLERATLFSVSGGSVERVSPGRAPV
jgi:DNA replication and repair protein RecF